MRSNARSWGFVPVYVTGILSLRTHQRVARKHCPDCICGHCLPCLSQAAPCTYAAHRERSYCQLPKRSVCGSPRSGFLPPVDFRAFQASRYPRRRPPDRSEASLTAGSHSTTLHIYQLPPRAAWSLFRTAKPPLRTWRFRVSCESSHCWRQLTVLEQHACTACGTAQPVTIPSGRVTSRALSFPKTKQTSMARPQPVTGPQSC